jgi:hypothetical protein
MKAKDYHLQALAWRGASLAVAGLCIWYDVRLFYLYVCWLLLRALDAIERLRAGTTIFEMTNDVRWVALARKVGVTQEDLAAAANDEREMVCTADLAFLEHLARDYSLAARVAVAPDAMFSPEMFGRALLKSEGQQ